MVSEFLIETANLVNIQFLLLAIGQAVNNDKSCVFTNVFRFSGLISLLIDSSNNDNEDILEPSGIVGVQARLVPARFSDNRYGSKSINWNVFTLLILMWNPQSFLQIINAFWSHWLVQGEKQLPKDSSDVPLLHYHRQALPVFLRLCQLW